MVLPKRAAGHTPGLGQADDQQCAGRQRDACAEISTQMEGSSKHSFHIWQRVWVCGPGREQASGQRQLLRGATVADNINTFKQISHLPEVCSHFRFRLIG